MFARFRRIDESIGFALSGGGVRGASQVGCLKALNEAGIEPAFVAGTSAGAVNATWFALYPHRLDKLEAIWLALRTRDVFPGSRIRSLLNLTRHGYIHAAEGWEAFLRREAGSATFEDAVIPCAVVAVRLADGERVVFDSGEIVPAIMASTAIPGVFPPYRIDGELYVDGAVREYLPVPTLIERDVRTIYALDCSSFLRTSDSPSSILDRCSRISSYAEVQRVTSMHATRGRKVHIVRPELPELDDGRDFGRTAEMVLAGYEATRRYLLEHVPPGRPGDSGPRSSFSAG
jgi:NTE family protein